LLVVAGDYSEYLPPASCPGRPLPAVFAAHQRGDQCDLGKQQVVGKSVDRPDQAYGLGLVQEGVVVLAPDANKVGERYAPNLREPWQCVGDPPCEAGPWYVRQRGCCLAPGRSWGAQRWKPVFDVRCGVDLLVQHPRADPTRIGMIGHSMGGDTVLWAMPWSERIHGAVISGSGLLQHFPPAGPYGLPYADILGLIAPARSWRSLEPTIPERGSGGRGTDRDKPLAAG
jgi:hypothetical protein